MPLSDRNDIFVKHENLPHCCVINDTIRGKICETNVTPPLSQTRLLLASHVLVYFQRLLSPQAVIINTVSV